MRRIMLLFVFILLLTSSCASSTGQKASSTPGSTLTLATTTSATGTPTASVAGIHVHVDASGREGLERVVDAREVVALSVRALLDVQVRNEVGKRIRLDDGHSADIRELCHLGGN